MISLLKITAMICFFSGVVSYLCKDYNKGHMFVLMAIHSNVLVCTSKVKDEEDEEPTP